MIMAPSGNHNGLVLGSVCWLETERVGLAGRSQNGKGLAKDVRNYLVMINISPETLFSSQAARGLA